MYVYLKTQKLGQTADVSHWPAPHPPDPTKTVEPVTCDPVSVLTPARTSDFQALCLANVRVISSLYLYKLICTFISILPLDCNFIGGNL